MRSVLWIVVVFVVACTSSPRPRAHSQAPPTPPATTTAPPLESPGPEPVAKGDGPLTQLELTTNPRVETISDLRFSITDAAGKAHAFHVLVPPGLPLPFARGDRIRFRASSSGSTSRSCARAEHPIRPRAVYFGRPDDFSLNLSGAAL